MSKQRGRRTIQAALYVGAWTLAAAGAGNLIVSYGNDPAHDSWLDALRRTLPFWYAWASLAPAVYLLSRRFPVFHGRWYRNLPIHFLAMPAASIAAMGIYLVLRTVLGLSVDSPVAVFSAGLPTMLVLYGLTVLVCHVLIYRRGYRDNQLRSQALARQLTAARLQVLRMQLNPHFLFNTLNAISALIRRDPAKADRMLADLGELLRLTVVESDAQTVPLESELDMLGRYLAIQKTRFGSKLNVEITVPKELLQWEVPSLILQPLVENAIEHGVSKRRQGGTVRLSGQEVDRKLCFAIVNDGSDSQEGGRNGSGWSLGLKNTRERLKELYGQECRLKLLQEAGEFRVELVIPRGYSHEYSRLDRR